MAALEKNKKKNFSTTLSIRSCILCILCLLGIFCLRNEFCGRCSDHAAVSKLYTTDSKTSSGFVDKSFVREHFATYSLEELKGIVRTWTMVSGDHLKFGVDAVAQINKNKVEGDIVECGVWKGGMTMAMVFENQRDNTDRHFWLFDTFEGLPQPVDPKNGKAAQNLYKLMEQNDISNAQVQKRVKLHITESGKWNYGPYEIVRNNIYYTGYPKEKFHLVRGKVEDTLKQGLLPEKIAILRLDTDWYESTKAELEVLYSRLQPGGVLIIDDFCAWQGAATAVREFFRDTLGLDADDINERNGKPCLYYWKPEHK